MGDGVETSAAALDAAADHPSLLPPPPGTTVRRPRSDDFAAVLGLHRRVARPGGDGLPDPDALRSEDELALLWEDARGDAVLVEDGGTLVGYADFQEVLDPWTPALELHVTGRVDPEHERRGVGTFLLGRALERARRAAARAPHLPTDLRTTLVDPDEDALAWHLRHGFRPIRYCPSISTSPMEKMISAGKVTLKSAIGASTNSAGVMTTTRQDGVTPLPWQGAAPRAVHRALRVAFADHHLGVTEDYDTWRLVALAGQRVQPRASVLAQAEGEGLVGLALGRMESGVEPGLAVITELGVVPSQRGRGVATALLREAFARLRDLGATRVGLEVDDVTLDGALRLYQRAGMEVVHHTVQLARPLD